MCCPLSPPSLYLPHPLYPPITHSPLPFPPVSSLASPSLTFPTLCSFTSCSLTTNLSYLLSPHLLPFPSPPLGLVSSSPPSFPFPSPRKHWSKGLQRHCTIFLLQRLTSACETRIRGARGPAVAAPPGNLSSPQRHLCPASLSPAPPHRNTATTAATLAINYSCCRKSFKGLHTPRH